MNLLILILAATADAANPCARYTVHYTPPPEAVAAARECGEGCERDLAERFANGDGVARNYDVAEYFLCQAEDDMAPAEFTGMSEHLQRMRSGEETAPLLFCDHVTSGRGAAYCSQLEYDRLMPKLEARVEALRSRVKATPRFDSLRKRGEAYVTAESTRIGELSHGGTAYAAITLDAEMTLKEQLVSSLERWSKQRAPSVSAADAKEADQALNSAYRAMQKEIDEGGAEIAEWKTWLRDAQRAWIAYRDAFAAYYAEQWSGKASPDALSREIVTQLTRERAADLHGEND